MSVHLNCCRPVLIKEFRSSDWVQMMYESACERSVFGGWEGAVEVVEDVFVGINDRMYVGVVCDSNC